MQPSVNQYADVVLGRHHPLEEQQLAETCDHHCQGPALLPTAFPTASPCSLLWRDLPFHAEADPLQHPLLPFGTNVGALHHSIAMVCTAATGTCWPGREFLDFMC